MLLLGEYQYRVVSGYFDRYRRIRPYAIFDVAQEAASSHIETFGLGYESMIQKNLIWVVARNKFVIDRDISSLKNLKVKTWPQPNGRFDTLRDFYIVDDNDNICVRGRTMWCLLDLKTKRLAPMSNATIEGEFYPHAAFEDKLQKITIDDNDKYVLCLEHRVQPSDLDWNQHMNNARYGELVYDAMNLQENEIIYSMEIDYIAQARLGDLITVKMHRHDKEILLVGYKEDAVCFLAKCIIR